MNENRRDPKYLQEFLELLPKLREKYPHMRIAQIIDNAVVTCAKQYHGSASVFYVEDDDLIQAMKAFQTYND